MMVEQFVMAYQVEQDRLRAMLPEGYESLRPVLRINAEIRKDGEAETVYLEFNTPVAAFGKRGWLNIDHWETPVDEFSYERRGSAVTLRSPFLEISYTETGARGGCLAEQDNDGCFFPGEEITFRPKEQIDSNKAFCDCSFAWSFTEGDAHGVSIGEKTKHVSATERKIAYEKQPLSAKAAASIPCEQILGAYAVRFARTV